MSSSAACHTSRQPLGKTSFQSWLPLCLNHAPRPAPRRPRQSKCMRQPVRKARYQGTCTCALTPGQNAMLEAAQTSPWRDTVATGCAIVAAVIWVKIFEQLAQRGFLDQVRSMYRDRSPPKCAHAQSVFDAQHCCCCHALTLMMLQCRN